MRARALGAIVAGLLATSGCGLPAGSTRPRAGPSDDEFARGKVVWPADGQVSSSFGPRGRTSHDGIDIAAPEGTPIQASAGGTVVFSGVLRGYGNTVILEHRGQVTTVYAHNRENLVETGARVDQGETIATVGQTGKTTGPNLHFEVRRSKVAEDPLVSLPARRTQSLAKTSSPVLVSRQAAKRAPAVSKREIPAKRRVGIGG
jgi:murein DD-endopeptidase MepM/ murein hydrolase activator NlpD